MHAVSSQMQLWITHTEAMIEDFARNHSNEFVVNEALHDIDKLLQEKGSSCAILGLPLPQGEYRGHDEVDDHNEEQQCLALEYTSS